MKNGVLHDRRADPVADRFDRHLDLRARALRVVRPVDRRERDHPLQHRRPRRRRRLPDLPAAAIDRHGDARRGRADRGGETELLVDPLDLGPVDLEADDLACVPARVLVAAAPAGR